MKLLKYGFYLLAIAASAVSCTRKDGDWDPIKTGENLMIHGEDFGFMKFENEWCEIVVPSESPNKLYIALKENDGREPRKIGIGMTVGDAFTSIDITQGSALLTTPNE